MNGYKKSRADIIDDFLQIETIRPPYTESERAKLFQILDSPIPAFVIKACEVLGKQTNRLDVAPIIEKALPRGGIISDVAARLITCHPFFNLEPRGDFNAGLMKSRTGLSAIETIIGDSQSERFQKSLKTALNSLRAQPVDTQKFVLQRMAEIPGIANLDINVIAIIISAEMLSYFRACRENWRRRQFPRQVTVSLTYRCNLNCPYCFAADMLRLVPKDISFKKLTEYIEYAVANGCTQLGFMGGEPLLYTSLPEAIASAGKLGLKSYFSTNLIDTHGLLSKLDYRCIGSVTVHLEHPEFYSSVNYKLVKNGLAFLSQTDVDVIIRYNMTSPHRRDWTFLEEAANMFNEPRISFSTTFPSRTGKTDYVPLPNLKAFSSKISDFAERFSKTGVQLFLAKPFPLCAFTMDELFSLCKTVAIKNICELHRNDYTNNIILHEDGYYQICMALSDTRFELPRPDDQSTSMDIAAIQNRNFMQPIMQSPLLEECVNCTLFIRQLCQAACFAYYSKHQSEKAT